MPERYLSQHDIAKMLDVDRTTVNVWRRRHQDFPAPDVLIGLGLDKPALPGWHPDRLDEIRAWVTARKR